MLCYKDKKCKLLTSRLTIEAFASEEQQQMFAFGHKTLLEVIPKDDITTDDRRLGCALYAG